MPSLYLHIYQFQNSPISNIVNQNTRIDQFIQYILEINILIFLKRYQKRLN